MITKNVYIKYEKYGKIYKMTDYKIFGIFLILRIKVQAS